MSTVTFAFEAFYMEVSLLQTDCLTLAFTLAGLACFLACNKNMHIDYCYLSIPQTMVSHVPNATAGYTITMMMSSFVMIQ